MKASIVPLILMLAVLQPGSALALHSEGDAEHTEAHSSHHHIALFLGATSETKRGIETRTDSAIGIEYEFRFSHYWGIGALVEFIGDDLTRENVVFVPVSLHFYDNFRLVGAPGIEIDEHETKFAFRIGLGYEFHLGKGFALVPEVNADFIQGGKITYVYGLALGMGL